MIKDVNEIFKFLIFIMNFNINIQSDREVIFRVDEMTREFIKGLCKLDYEKSIFVLKYFFMETVIENLGKTKDLTQLLLINIIYYFVDGNESSLLEILKIVLEKVQNKEIVFKILEVFTKSPDFYSDANKDLPKILKDYLRESRISNTVNQKAFFIKLMINFLEIDVLFVQKIWKRYEEFFNERHNENLISIYFVFLAKFYNKCIEVESLSGTVSDQPGPAKEKKVSYEVDLKKAKMVDKKKPQTFPSEKVIEKVNCLLRFAGKSSMNTFFIHFGVLIESNQKILEMYLNRLVESEIDRLDEYLALNKEFNINEKIDDLIENNEASSISKYWSNTRFFWILFDNKEFSNQVYIRNGLSIINYLLKLIADGLNSDAHILSLWRILKFCFFNCKFETLNFEHFDFISNSIFNFVLEELGKGNFHEDLMSVLKLILTFEIRNELSLKNFEKFFEKVYSSLEVKTAIIALLTELYGEFKENEVYQNNFFMKFGVLKSEINI
jgi:hypothetical protein